MEEKQQFEVWKEDVLPAIQSKFDEFILLGYDQVSKEKIWECVVYKLRKQKTFIHLHEFVSVIMTLKVTDYMNYLTVTSYQGGDWFKDEGVSLDELTKEIK